jgi:hypothetical protein
MTTRTAIASVLGFAVLCPALGLTLVGADEHKPKDAGLVETAGAHLGQIDVTVTGPRDAASHLTPSDFDIQVGKQWLKTFHLDRACADDSSSATSRPASYVFYFDQRHLTPSGRRRAIEVLREMVPRLIVNGSRGMVVSSAKTLKVFATFTPRREEILSALEKIESDPSQVDPLPVEEEARVDEIRTAVQEERAEQSKGGKFEKFKVTVPHFCGAPRANRQRDEQANRATSQSADGSFTVSAAADLAQQFEREEMAEAREGLLRVVGMLRRLGGVDPPKAFLYFSDTMRRNAGEHFATMVPPEMLTFSRTVKRSGPVSSFGTDSNRQSSFSHWSGNSKQSSGASSGNITSVGPEGSFNEVLAEAAAQNVRFYPVQAEGLTDSSPRARDAQDTLASLAAESGGKAFLNGVPADRMSSDILADLSCRYVVSFDPAGFPMDRPLAVHVGVRRGGVAAQAGSQIVIQSEAARRASRLLTAFSQATRTGSGAISATVIPIGYVHGAFSALVQLVVPPASGDPGSWEIGGSVVSGNSARDLPKRTITTNTLGIPVIFESEETFSRAQQEVIAVAREAASDTVVSQVVDVTWPEIDERVSILPTIILQPAAGAFARGDATRTRGSVARSESEPLRFEVATTLVSLVCWPAEQDDPLHVLRTLRGDAETILSFPAIDLDTGNERCAQVRDTIPAKVLGAGVFRYAVVVSQGQEELARAERAFTVLTSPE